MKEWHACETPRALRYTPSHEWVALEGETVRVGITDFAQDQLGDIVYVELPQPGTSLAKGAVLGVVESVKAVAELYAPLEGRVVSSNEALQQAPERVNQDPYGEGWMVTLTPEDPGEIEALLTEGAYRDLLKGTA